MPPHREHRVAQDGADDVLVDALRRQNVDLQRQVELLTERMNEFVNVHRHEDDVTVTDKNPFGALLNRSKERSANRWEQSFKVEILTFAGSLKLEDFIDWLSQANEIMDFKNVPDDRCVPLVVIRLRSRAHAWWKQLKQIHVRSDFYESLARLDLNESLFQLVSHYIGGLRLQLKDVLNMFDPLTVGKAHQRDSQAKKQLNRHKPGCPQTPTPTRGPPNVPQGRLSGGLNNFNCSEFGHRESDCRNPKPVNRGLFTEAQESNSDPISTSSPISDSALVYDEYPEDVAEEYVSGDIGPLLMLRRAFFVGNRYLNNLILH
ncbi:hypothetical protein Tco_1508824 [Tanacetum coccineum]